MSQCPCQFPALPATLPCLMEIGEAIADRSIVNRKAEMLMHVSCCSGSLGQFLKERNESPVIGDDEPLGTMSFDDAMAELNRSDCAPDCDDGDCAPAMANAAEVSPALLLAIKTILSIAVKLLF